MAGIFGGGYPGGPQREPPAPKGPQQRVVIYTKPDGEVEVYATTYGDEDYTMHLIEQCKLRNPGATEVHVLDSSVAFKSNGGI